jgi:hypothetical protein
VIGRKDLGAVDFPIAAPVRCWWAMGDVGRLVADRPAETIVVGSMTPAKSRTAV